MSLSHYSTIYHMRYSGRRLERGLDGRGSRRDLINSPKIRRSSYHWASVTLYKMSEVFCPGL